jgi:glyoxylate reductase
MTSQKLVAVFTLTHPWMQETVLKAAPPQFEVLFLNIKDEGAAQKLLPRADFLMTMKLPSTYLPLLKNCKLVQLHGVGYDGVDTEGLAKLGIPIAACPEGTITGVAEHTVLLILALYKQLVRVHESMREGKYDSMAWRPGSHLLCGKTLGIVGLGRAGRRVSHVVRGFDINLIYYDLFRAPAAVEEELGATYVPFGELMSRADIISVHAPLTAETRGLFGAHEFARMKPGALFINTSRGGTYDLDALYERLRSGHLGGAGLDVFSPEPPPPDHPILRLPNVICTPHTAAGTVESQLEKVQVQFDNFMRVLRGETPRNLLKLP